MSTIIVKNGSELDATLFAGTQNHSINRIRSPFLFRGVVDADYEIGSSLMRLKHDKADVERPLYRSFRKYAFTSMDERPTFWKTLTIAQHHGLPTRLIDWTYSPLVALHFATNEVEKGDKDAAIWKVHVKKAHELLPEDYRKHLTEERTDVFSTEMLEALIPSFLDLKKIDEQTKTLAFFFEPPSMDARIVNQYAALSFLTDKRLKMNDWLQDSGVEYSKIVIPAGLKKEIRDKLDLANITERVLFPGLDGISSWLKRYYMNL